MKQLLLRVPDDVHRRLAMRAAREGRSVNALATELLDLGAGADQGDRRARLRAKAAAEGILGSVPAPVVGPRERREILASTRGFGPVVDALLADERDRP
jgi:plasmid stability protein